MENTCGLNFQKNVHIRTAVWVTVCLGWHWQLVASVAQQQEGLRITTGMMAGRCNFDPEYWKFYQAVNSMNLVAKEFCAASLERNSVLILAESAGAADQLQDGALMVNPNDQIANAEAIYRAFKMPFAERSERMDRLRHIIRETDVYWWVNSFLKASFAENIDYFLKVEDYRPQIDLD
jgi:hypothetical protein